MSEVLPISHGARRSNDLSGFFNVTFEPIVHHRGPTTGNNVPRTATRNRRWCVDATGPVGQGVELIRAKFSGAIENHRSAFRWEAILKMKFITSVSLETPHCSFYSPYACRNWCSSHLEHENRRVATESQLCPWKRWENHPDRRQHAVECHISERSISISYPCLADNIPKNESICLPQKSLR